MILVDTSIWVDHLRKGDQIMQQLLDNDEVLSHPLVIGELAMGNLHPRDAILNALQQIPSASVAAHHEVLRLVAQHRLYGLGIGFVDAHLLAAARLTPEAVLWTRDKRLYGIAETLHLAFRP
jgi:hypothetical protein